MLKVVYIAGMSRSGSTILEMFMATHPQMVSVGESLHSIMAERATQHTPEDNWPCSCGHSRQECEFWGPLLPQLRDGSLTDAFELVVARFQEFYPGMIFVDSSKELRSLELFYLPLARRGLIDLRAVHIVRDMRAWASSVTARRRKWGEKTHYVVEAYRWLWSTLQALRFLKRNRIPTMMVSHEDFTSDSERYAALLARFLDVDNGFAEEKLTRARAHELYGSPHLKFDPQRRSRIVYDSTWVHDWRPFAYGPLTIPPLVMNYRLQNVIRRNHVDIERGAAAG